MDPELREYLNEKEMERLMAAPFFGPPEKKASVHRLPVPTQKPKRSPL